MLLPMMMATMMIMLASSVAEDYDPVSRCISQRVPGGADPMIGTKGDGHEHPGATMPFGMVQLSPSNGQQNRWSHCSGYTYESRLFAGMVHTALSGTGLGDFGDLLVTPGGGAWPLRHEDECALPGLYTLRHRGCSIEATATERVGSLRLRCPEASFLTFDLKWGQNSKTTNFSVDYRSGLLIGSRRSEGFGRRVKKGVKEPRATRETFFACKFDEEFYVDIRGARATVTSRVPGVLTSHCALSATSIRGAALNLQLESKSLEAAKLAAQTRWREELHGKFAVRGGGEHPLMGDLALQTAMRTALYHSLLTPNLVSDADGDAPSQFGGRGPAYSTLSTWDTFRAQAPLLTLIRPDVASKIALSMVKWAQNNDGRLPKWLLWASETDTMIAYHGVAILADALLKGLVEDEASAVEAILATTSNSVNERGVTYHSKLQRIPSRLVAEAVSLGLELSVDDACAARAIGRSGAARLERRSKMYAKYFHEGYFRGDDGSTFDPLRYHYAHDREAHDFTEGSALQYLFIPAMTDLPGLRRLLGEGALERRLDELFDPGLGGHQAGARDVTGCLSGSQYCHGNEVVHHAAYLYSALGQPWKTQEKIDDMLVGHERLYGTAQDGLPGNDDAGQLSAWLFFSALGLYPRDPCAATYELGRPIVVEANVTLGDSCFLRVIAHGQSPDAKYVREVRLDGRKLDRTFIRHAEIAKGAILEFVMSTTLLK